MKVTKDKVENSQAFLTIEMEPAEVEQSMEAAYQRLVKRANIPGFRKGKAPRSIFERYIGKEAVLEDAINKMLPDTYEKALKQAELEAIAPPQFEIAQTEPLTIKATVPLKPTIKLGDYHVKMTREPVKIIDEAINATIEQLRHQHASWEPVERPAQLNDLVVLDIKSEVEGSPYLNRQGVQFNLLKEQIYPAPGFVEQIVDLKKGEEKEFKLKFPDDFPRKELAGKEALFRVKLNEIKEEKLPELNDDFAVMVSPELKTFEDLKKEVTTTLKRSAEERALREFEDRILDEIVKVSQVEFPQVLVEREIDHLLEHQLSRWPGKYEDYLKAINKTEQELRDTLQPQAKKQVAESVVLGKIAEAEKIEASDAEIDTEIGSLTSSVSDDKDRLQKSLNSPQGRQSVRDLLLTRKTLQRLVEIAEGKPAETTEKPAEAAQKEDK